MTSPAQLAQQALYAAVRPRWSATLTEAQRTAWRAFTEQYPRKDQLGQKYVPCGIARFCGMNAISYKYAHRFLDDPPADLHCHQPTLVTIPTATSTPQALEIHIEGTLDADEYWVLASILGCSAGTFYLTNRWSAIAFGADALPYTFNATAAYTATFGPLIAAAKIAARFQIANTATGTISRPIFTTTIVT